MKYKTFSKKYHFPGCQNGKEDIKFVPMPPCDPGPMAWQSAGQIVVSQPQNPLSFNSDAIKLTHISVEVFKDAEEVSLNPLNLVERSVEIFSASPERKNDRASWVYAIQHIGRLSVKKHQHGGQTILVVTPFTLK